MLASFILPSYCKPYFLKLILFFKPCELQNYYCKFSCTKYSSTHPLPDILLLSQSHNSPCSLPSPYPLLVVTFILKYGFEFFLSLRLVILLLCFFITNIEKDHISVLLISDTLGIHLCNNKICLSLHFIA